MSDSHAPATVVLVHGAFHGAWCWEKVVPGLEAAGVPVRAVDLPGHGQSAPPPGDLYTHADWLRGELAGIDGPVVLVGHSYGGAVISDGAAGADNVERLVYICALMPEVGETAMTVIRGGPPPEDPNDVTDDRISPAGDGTLDLPPREGAATFYSDCGEDVLDAAMLRLTPQSVASLGQPLRAAAWHDIPSTYVVCSEDQVINPDDQRRMSKRADEVREWPTSHSPFFSQPELVVDLLLEYAAADARS